ncbi:hypothetical protein QQ045_006012 [Rhodiola kirilowii]
MAKPRILADWTFELEFLYYMWDCLDNVDAVKKLKSAERGDHFERHSPEKGKGLNCLIPQPKNYKHHIPWPKSLDETESSSGTNKVTFLIRRSSNEGCLGLACAASSANSFPASELSPAVEVLGRSKALMNQLMELCVKEDEAM